MPTQATAQLLKGIHAFEGMLSQRQITDLFFPGCTSTWPATRLNHYFDHHLVNKFDASFVNGMQLGEIVYTLGTAGAQYVARELASDLDSFSWRKQPRWLTLAHDLKLNDFRIAVTRAAAQDAQFELARWLSEHELSQDTSLPGRPDGFFILRRQSPTQYGRVEELALLPELDNSNHSLSRFVRKKVKPALKFVGSPAYERRFGVPYGAYFVVTTGPGRLENLKRKTEEAGGSGLFYFTTFDQVTQDSVLTASIWQLAGSTKRYALATMPLSPDVPIASHYLTQRQLSFSLG